MKDARCLLVGTPVINLYTGNHLTTTGPFTRIEAGVHMSFRWPTLVSVAMSRHCTSGAPSPSTSRQSDCFHACRLAHSAPRRPFKPCTAAASQGATQRGRRPRQLQEEQQRQQQQDNEGGSRNGEPRPAAEGRDASSAAGLPPDADDGDTDGAHLLWAFMAVRSAAALYYVRSTALTAVHPCRLL